MTAELPFDILAHTLTLIPRRGDLLALMKTCRPLYEASTHHLLRDEVFIWMSTKMRSFHQFMFADVSRFERLIAFGFW